MGHAHLHAPAGDVEVAVSRRAGAVVLGLLAVLAVATVVGLVVLWPSDDDQAAEVQAQFAAPGVSFPRAEVVGLEDSCDSDVFADNAATAPSCAVLEVQLRSGPEEDRTVAVEVLGPTAEAGLRAGDVVQLMRVPPPEGTDGEGQYSFFGVDRQQPLLVMTLLFVVVVLIVARWRGLAALVGLAFSGFMVLEFILPGLLSGQSGLWTALVGSSAIMFVVLYLAHGPTMRTTAALAGTVVGITITAVLAEVAVAAARLSGVGDDSGARLASIQPTLDFQELLTAAVVIAGLGVLNDVTITQASAVWELRAAGPGLSRRRIFSSGMRIGRDHIASTIYTIVFAYAGAALSVLLLIRLYDRPFADLIGTEDISTEMVRVLASVIGLVLTVPVTTAIAALTVEGPRPDADVPRTGATG